MAILAIGGILFAIYQTFFYERRALITFSSTLPAKVLDIHQPIGGLEIYYSGESLRASRKTLWVISSIIKNEGNAEVKIGDYDERNPLGILVEKGQIAEPPSITASNSYLKENIRIDYSKSKTTLRPVILEPGDSIAISLLVLGDEQSQPDISPIGKIAGVRELYLTNATSESSASILQKIFHSETWWIQALRLIGYFLLGFVFMGMISALIILVITPVESLKEKRKKEKRSKKIENYKHGETLSREARVLVDFYKEKDVEILFEINELIKATANRYQLMRQLSPHLEPDIAEEICRKMYKISHHTRLIIIQKLSEFGFPNDTEASEERLSTWRNELNLLANHLNINLDDEKFLSHLKNTKILQHQLRELAP